MQAPTIQQAGIQPWQRNVPGVSAAIEYWVQRHLVRGVSSLQYLTTIFGTV
jgi:hypothetical protein